MKNSCEYLKSVFFLAEQKLKSDQLITTSVEESAEGSDENFRSEQHEKEDSVSNCESKVNPGCVCV